MSKARICKIWTSFRHLFALHFGKFYYQQSWDNNLSVILYFWTMFFVRAMSGDIIRHLGRDLFTFVVVIGAINRDIVSPGSTTYTVHLLLYLRLTAFSDFMLLEVHSTDANAGIVHSGSCTLAGHCPAYLVHGASTYQWPMYSWNLNQSSTSPVTSTSAASTYAQLTTNRRWSIPSSSITAWIF